MNFLYYLQLAAGLLPLVQAAESAIPMSGAGQQKAALVNDLVAGAADASGAFLGGKVNPTTIASALMKLIPNVVNALNKAGIFHHGVPTP